MRKGIMIVLIVLALGSIVAEASEHPLLIVECLAGCNSDYFDSTTNTYRYVVDQNTEVNLLAKDLSGESGQVFTWTQISGFEPNGAEYLFTVTEDVQLTVTVDKENMIDRKNIEIVLSSVEQKSCSPTWSDPAITISGEKDSKDIAPGDTVAFEANFYDLDGGCIIHWVALSNNISTEYVVIKSFDDSTMEATISPEAPSGTWITVKAILESANDPLGKTSEGAISFSLADKAAEIELTLSHSSAVSYDSFRETVADSSGANRIRNCSLILKNETGFVVDQNEGTAEFRQPMDPIDLDTKEVGVYTVVATCSDGHGTIITETETVPVGISESLENIPNLKIDDVWIFSLDKPRIIYFNETKTFNRSVLSEYSDVTYGDYVETSVYQCEGYLRCNLNLSNPGTYQIKIRSWYLWYSIEDREFKTSYSSERIIFVTVVENYSQTSWAPTETSSATAAEQLPETDLPVKKLQNKYITPKTPSAGVFAAIAAIALAYWRKK